MIKYLKIIKLFMFTIIAAAFLYSCNDYVSDIEEPIDNVADEELNTPSAIPFLVQGIQARFATTWDEHSLFGDGLGDAMWFSTDVPQATYTTYFSIDRARITGSNPLLPQNNSTEAIMAELAQLRLYTDTLIERIEKRIKFNEADENDMYYRDFGLYSAYFYGAIARYMWASYWTLEPTDGGGGVINNGPYISGATMYSDALARLDKALEYATSEQDVKIVNTMKARIYLITGDFIKAGQSADIGLTPGDPSFDVLYNTVGENQWYYWAGPGRTQFVADNRYLDYIQDSVWGNPQEENRIPLYALQGYSGTIYIEQGKYTELGSPMVFMSWQENALMRAELAIRGGDNATGLDLVNLVRSSHSIDPIDDAYVQAKFAGVYLDMIYEERDKELCFTGMRLIDQNRFNKWHLDPANSWNRLPIGYDERNANPNFD